MDEKRVIQNRKLVSGSVELADLLLPIESILLESFVKKRNVLRSDIKRLPVFVPSCVEADLRLITFGKRNRHPVGMLLGRVAPPARFVVKRPNHAFLEVFEKMLLIRRARVAF